MNKAANQWVFTRAWNHIIKQRRASTDAVGCVYHAPNGLMCAFAPAIETYTPKMEGCNAEGLIKDWNENLYPEAREADPHLCNLVQAAHDDNAGLDEDEFISYFKDDMELTAEQFDLEVPTDGRD